MASLRQQHRAPLSKSAIMGRIRGRDTRPELATRSALHRLGWRFRANVQSLPGKPDIAIKSRRIAIFVHGCFWHLHEGCRLARQPKGNTAYWGPKLRRNVERDAQQRAQLQTLGFRVLRPLAALQALHRVNDRDGIGVGFETRSQHGALRAVGGDYGYRVGWVPAVARGEDALDHVGLERVALPRAALGVDDEEEASLLLPDPAPTIPRSSLRRRGRRLIVLAPQLDGVQIVHPRD